ncbi:glycosyltransferase family 4 protein [Afipia massiliensis]|uniref:Glycosyltransferase family 4 protein n=1 Tax=Afipia massiliensis TaxID=211460 RepID=A0A4U6BR39_9BRAD|nr:glycosyltransferase family 4 protein [Afipia massiliensis]TKT72401.1 glycosyltransferase family 4 protein [Afipia massiliensis]
MNLLIVTGIFPPDHGGPASYVPRMASALADRGHNIVAVVTLSDRLRHNDSAFGFNVVRLLRGEFRPMRWVRTVLTIRKYAVQADAVYLNGLVMEGVVATRFLRHTPTAVKVVGDLIWEKARNVNATSLDIDAFQIASLPIGWRFLRRLQKLYTACVDAVIVPSNYLARIVSGWSVNAHRIHTVYNAVDSAEATNSETRGAAAWDIVVVARLVPWKGLVAVIKAAAAMRKSLKIVGDGPMRGELEALAQELNADVTFTGHVRQSQVRQEIRSARLFVLNSSYEGLPHIVLEAKSAGIPVLATKVGGTPETIDHGVNGWLIEAGDDAALQNALGRLLSDASLRESLVVGGFEQMKTRFSFQAMVDATEHILQGIAKPRREAA